MHNAADSGRRLLQKLLENLWELHGTKEVRNGKALSDYDNFSSSSERRTILEGGTLSMAAILTTTRMLELLMPRSIRLM